MGLPLQGVTTRQPPVRSWGNGDAAAKTFNVTISPDATSEPNELFSAAITNATGGAVIGTPNTVGVTIVNDDGDPLPPLMGSLSFQAEERLIAAPYINSGTTVFQLVETVVVADGGLARWRVTDPLDGNLQGRCHRVCNRDQRNSLFIEFDGEPVTPTHIWDVAPLNYRI